MLLIGQNSVTLSSIKEKLKFKFEMKDLRPTRKILGMKINMNRIKEKLFLTQKTNIENGVKNFSLYDTKLVSLPLFSCVKLSVDQ